MSTTGCAYAHLSSLMSVRCLRWSLSFVDVRAAPTHSRNAALTKAAGDVS
ncbi:hypothetical protein [uncultured Nostoc sp.]